MMIPSQRPGGVSFRGRELAIYVARLARALIFTQFDEIGGILRRHLEETFGREVFLLHGQVPKAERDRMVERFQSSDGEGSRLIVLSVKPGGSGLNLTAANHVLHFDRWWNAAVENQATDPAFRIGQKQDVQVHKIVCIGTVEEKIDEVIDRNQAPGRRFHGRHW
jgi:SNF2 family DNA or RNA helicase